MHGKTCGLCEQLGFKRLRVPDVETVGDREKTRMTGGEDGTTFPDRGPAATARHPVLTDASYGRRPGTPSNGARRFERPVTEAPKDIGPTDLVNPFPRSAAEGGRVRAVNLQYVLVGGPACTAPNSRGWGWVHNYGYLTIADTLKPAQQLPRYNMASVDTETVLDRARASVLRTLYGGSRR